MKQKEGPYQKKRSLRLTREDAARLCRGDYFPLLTYKEPFAAECYGLMNCRCYRPRVIVEYRRQAYIARENHIRVTPVSYTHLDVYKRQPPSLGLITLNALAAADQVLIPIQCEFYALEGLSQLINTIKLVRKHINAALEIEGVVLKMCIRDSCRIA